MACRSHYRLSGRPDLDGDTVPKVNVIALLAKASNVTVRQCDNVPRTPRFLGGRVAEGLPVVKLAPGMTGVETSVETAGVTGACATNGAYPAMPDMHLGTDSGARS